MSETRFCGACGQSNGVDARFCGRCGQPLPAWSPPAQPVQRAPEPARPAPAANRTLAHASIDPAALAAHVAAIQAEQAAAAAPVPQPVPPAPAPRPKAPEPSASTMMGVSFDAPAVASVPATPAQPTPRARVQYATMIDPPREPSSFEPPIAETRPAAPVPTAAPISPAAPLAADPPPASAPVAAAPVAAPPLAAPPVAAAPVSPALPPAPVAPAAKPAMRTMLGMAAFTPPGAAIAARSADTGAAPLATPEERPAPPAPAAEPATFSPPGSAPSSEGPAPNVSRPRDQIMKTMLGAALVTPGAQRPAAAEPAPSPPSPSPSPTPPAADASAKAPMKTMMGMSFDNLMPRGEDPQSAADTTLSPVSPVGPTEVAPAPIPMDAAPAPIGAEVARASLIDGQGEGSTAQVAARKQLGPSNRTMLGVIAPPEALAKAEQVAAARDAMDAAPPPPVVAPAPAVHPYTSAHAPDVGPTGDMSIAGLPSPRRRVNAVLVAVLVLGTLLVVGAIGAFFFFNRGPGRTVEVTPTHSEERGEVLRVSVAGLPAGSRARFGSAEEPFSGTTAELPLAADTLHVGDNPLAIDIVLPDGSVETHQVTLTLNYRVRADLGALSGTPPAIVVVVEALAGATATLDGQPLTFDGTGRATRSYPLEGMTASAEGVVEHIAHYVITTPGAPMPVQGSLTTRVPLTTMHLDRPGEETVTDRAEVEIAGAVQAGATLTIDGAPVTVLPEGRFLHRYPLPAVGEFSPRIVAVAPSRAPVVRTLHIRRVADLAREAAGFTYDRTLTYARLVTAPTTFVGQRVMYEGRVYNVDVHDGRGVLQMLVRDCPSGSRCPIWVNYSAAIDVTVESWVRVLGVVEGEQQFRSTNGEVRTVPSVTATFVVPARP